jgi:N-methylhydantoinase B
MAKPKVDPFTMEIIKDALVAIGDEMFVATQRTSMSTIIYEVLDYACGLTNGVTGFLGTLASGVQSVLDKFGLAGLEAGDIVILNDCEPQAGGWGAGHDKDGESGLVCVGDGETHIIPIEVCETRYGVLVDQYGFDICEGGAGRYRGGRGLVRDYLITADEAWYTGTFGRHKFTPWAMEGGQEGSPNYTKFIFADGREPVVVGKSACVHLKKGDVARLITATGGGWGNPYERPVEAVQEDVKHGYITVEMAEKDYGVIVDANTLEITGITRERAVC